MREQRSIQRSIQTRGVQRQQSRLRLVRDASDSSTEMRSDVGSLAPRHRNNPVQRRRLRSRPDPSHSSFLFPRRTHFLILLQDLPFLINARIETRRIESIRNIARNDIRQEDL